ncbi:hypothetical protein MMC13_005889 [Lambiella insularis]|nr:hypothetical protein [Lambiella insularis]
MNPRWRTPLHVDDASQCTLKPVIRELARTEVHPPFLKLLVDKLWIVSQRKGKAEGGKTEAYKLWLSDGEKKIQAVLRREIHRYFIVGEIREGSYVHVTKYQLTSAKSTSREGTVLFLLVSDLYPIGHDRRPAVDTPVTETHDIQTSASESCDDEQTPKRTQRHEPGSASSKSPGTASAPGSARRERADSPFGHSASDLDSIDLLPWYDEPSAPKAARSSANGAPKENSTSKKRIRDESPSPSPSALQPRHPNLSSRPSKAPRLLPPKPPPAPLLPITRPLTLIPLAHLTGALASRNKIVDVLAVVSAVTLPLVRCRNMPDGVHYKRELRLADPSTPKRVMLSVFVAPAAFLPAVGTVALFRSVTTNRWDGGSLNAFGRDCAGRRWCLQGEEAGEVGCDVEGMRRWWEGRGEDGKGKGEGGKEKREDMQGEVGK